MSSVLIIEDELNLSRILARVLEEEGFQALVEYRGDRGLETAVASAPDAVVLDLSLPGMDGLRVCRELRARGLRMPVIMLTARDAVPDRVRGLDQGADDYLVKPFAIEELIARIRAHLRRAGEPAERLVVADLVLEPSARRVRRGGREVNLTAQEFDLLEFLMRHRGQVMSRQRILDHVWGYEAVPVSNIVDIYIHYLRDKVDNSHKAKLIKTVRSVGYVLRT
ncbi:MAG: response regulator transcription factor [Candidatus Dormibacteraceae bacterium]